MWTVDTLALVTAAFVFGGMVKGVVGLGLPIAALAFLAPTLGVKPAIAIMLMPCLVTNIWQGLTGGALVEILQRLWTMLLAACVGIWAGVAILAATDGLLLAGLLGVLLFVYAGLSVWRPQISPPVEWEPWLSPLIGGLSGLAFGTTGSFMVPGVLYLQSLGLKRDTLVQAMGVSFSVISATLGLSFAKHQLLPAELGLLSVAALIPTALGMVLGQLMRHWIPERHFRQVFFAALAMVGLYMIGRAFL